MFISHKMKEVLALADEVEILRRGEIVDSFLRADVPDERELAARMIGRNLEPVMELTPVPKGDVLLRLENARCARVEGVSFSLRQGEVLAVAGVAGNGQKELVGMLTGLREPEGGTLDILGKDWKGFFHTPVRQKDGLVYIPEDRKGLATCPTLNLTDNFVLTNRLSFVNGPFMDWKRGEAATREAIREFNVQPPDPSVPAGSLSGGNLQKLVIAREFSPSPPAHHCGKSHAGAGHTGHGRSMATYSRRPGTCRYSAGHERSHRSPDPGGQLCRHVRRTLHRRVSPRRQGKTGIHRAYAGRGEAGGTQHSRRI